MITEQSGDDLFQSTADALVNPVNCVGVMGKGLAAQFKRRYPANYREYAVACCRGEVRIGSMFTTTLEAGGRTLHLVNFPTKGHWRDPSDLNFIRLGLADLQRVVDDRGIRSIAIPALGCGLGGLDWPAVRELIIAAFFVADVDAVLYPPQ